MFSTCVFAHRSKLLLNFVHGDDYVGLGVRGDLEGYKAKLSERFIIKDRGILGADGLHEIRILNRVITYHLAKPGCPEMLTYEEEQRHADLLMAANGLNASSKAKATPWDKAAFLARHPLAGPVLDVKSISPIQENSIKNGYDENDENNMSDETKCETNYSINNKWNNTRNKHFTKHDTNDDVDLDNCVVHTVR